MKKIIVVILVTMILAGCTTDKEEGTVREYESNMVKVWTISREDTATNKWVKSSAMVPMEIWDKWDDCN